MQQRLASGRPSHHGHPEATAGVVVDLVVGLEPPERQRGRAPTGRGAAPGRAPPATCARSAVSASICSSARERGPELVEQAPALDGYSSSTSLRYAAASSSPSSSAGSDISIAKIQPAPYGLLVDLLGRVRPALVHLDDDAGERRVDLRHRLRRLDLRARRSRAITVEPDIGELRRRPRHRARPARNR